MLENTRLFGEAIRKAILSSGCSMNSIALALEFTSPRTIYRWMNGECLPSFSNFLSLLRIIGPESAGRLVSEITNLPFFILYSQYIDLKAI